MKFVLTFIAVITLVATTLAFDLGSQQPVKPVTSRVAPPADAEVLRQGGDTIADATVITNLPHYYTGTTVGYTDDYDYM